VVSSYVLRETESAKSPIHLLFLWPMDQRMVVRFLDRAEGSEVDTAGRVERRPAAE